MAASEAVPYAKSGGLGDVVGALSEHLFETGIDTRVIIPRYKFIDTKDTVTVLENISVPVGFEDTIISVLEGKFPGSDTPVYFVEHPLFSETDHIYGSGDHAYHNNAARFALLSRAVFSICEGLNWIPDIIHSHDWPTGLIPAFLNVFEKNGAFSHVKTVHSIHNLGYQGVFSKHDIHETRLSLKDLYGNNEHLNDNMNYMASGLENADYLTTVSPTYAKEIQTEEQGFGLHNILTKRSADLTGIINGIDYSIWNPEKDTAIKTQYSERDLSKKTENKMELAKLCGFPEPELPLFVMVSRLVEQKGFRDLFEGEWFETFLLENRCNYIILGTGESWAENAVIELDSRHENFKGYVLFNEELAHLIEAGSDFFVMPSRYEPCGLNQLYSLRYGSIPIVCPTGGLADTVVPLENPDSTGIYIEANNGHDILNALNKAIDLWENKKGKLTNMRIRGMKLRFSWDRSAREYIKLYESLVKK